MFCEYAIDDYDLPLSLPNEIWYIIIGMLDGFERENIKLVCKDFYPFVYNIKTSTPERHREVRLMRCDQRTVNRLAYYGYIDILLLLLNRKYYDISDIMHNACIGGNLNIVKMLAASYTDPIDWYDCICGAASSGYLSIIQYIYDNYYEDGFLQSCIVGALMGGHKDIIDYSLMRGAMYPSHSLNIVCAYGHEHIIDDLTGHYNYDEAFVVACVSGNINIIKKLLDKEWLSKHSQNRVNTINTIFDGLQAACQLDNCYDIFEYVFKYYYHNIGHQDIITLMQSACFYDNINIFKYLMTLQPCDPCAVHALSCNLRLQICNGQCNGQHQLGDFFIRSCIASTNNIALMLLPNIDINNIDHKRAMKNICIGGNVYLAELILPHVRAHNITKYIELACSHHNDALVDYLLTNTEPDITKLLYCVCSYSNSTILEVLLNHGATLTHNHMAMILRDDDDMLELIIRRGLLDITYALYYVLAYDIDTSFKILCNNIPNLRQYAIDQDIELEYIEYFNKHCHLPNTLNNFEFGDHVDKHICERE